VKIGPTSWNYLEKLYFCIDQENITYITGSIYKSIANGSLDLTSIFMQGICWFDSKLKREKRLRKEIKIYWENKLTPEQERPLLVSVIRFLFTGQVVAVNQLGGT